MGRGLSALVVYFEDQGGVPLMRNDDVIKRPADPAELTKLYTDEAIWHHSFSPSRLPSPFFSYCRGSASPGSLEDARTRASPELQRLPLGLRSLEQAAPYRVEISSMLRQLAKSLDDAAVIGKAT